MEHPLDFRTSFVEWILQGTMRKGDWKDGGAGEGAELGSSLPAPTSPSFLPVERSVGSRTWRDRGTWRLASLTSPSSEQ